MSRKEMNDQFYKGPVNMRVIYLLKKYTNENSDMNFDELCRRVYGMSEDEWNCKGGSAMRKDRRKTVHKSIDKLSEMIKHHPFLGEDDQIILEKENDSFYYNHALHEDQAMTLINSVLQSKNIDPEELKDIIEAVLKCIGGDYEHGIKSLFEKGDLNYQNMNASDTMHKTAKYGSKIGLKAGHFESKDVIGNLETLYKFIALGKEKKVMIQFRLYQYKFSGKNSRKGYFEAVRDGYQYRVTPLQIAVKNGKPWLIAVSKKYADQGISFFPIDIMDDIEEVSEEDKNEEEFKRYDEYMTRINQYFVPCTTGMGYDQPKQIVIRVKKKDSVTGEKIETAYTYIYNAFGEDFYLLEEGEEYDRILVVRSEYPMINWAIANMDKVEIENEEIRQKIRERIQILNQIYSEGE